MECSKTTALYTSAHPATSSNIPAIRMNRMGRSGRNRPATSYVEDSRSNARKLT